jgi:hypothetical protein
MNLLRLSSLLKNLKRIGQNKSNRACELGDLLNLSDELFLHDIKNNTITNDHR